MKKTILILALLFSVMLAQAQIYYLNNGAVINVNEVKDTQYIGATTWLNMLGTKISQFRFDLGVHYGLYGETVTDKNGKKVIFRSLMQMLNYFYKNGWELKAVFSITQNTVIFYTFERKEKKQVQPIKQH